MSRRPLFISLAVALLLLLGLLPAASPVRAATITVDSLLDTVGSCSIGGSCTLRAAIAAANGAAPAPGDTIQIAVTGTISGNVATGTDASIIVVSPDSGAPAQLTLTNSTIANNTAPRGIDTSVSTTVQFRNSIVVGETSALCNGPGTIVSLGNNVSNSASCFTHNPAHGDVVTLAPLLGPLAVNAPGTTATHALLPGSPAIDGVTFNATDCPATIATDQRGVSRPRPVTAARCDIGAYELASNQLPALSPFSPVTIDEDTVTPPIPFTVGDLETPLANLVVTATSLDQALVPDSGIEVIGNGANRTLRITPAANQFGPATINVTVNDGVIGVIQALQVNVTAVNDPPVAVGESYSTGAAVTLTVPSVSGVLANDSDTENTLATAILASQPAHGNVTLAPNGGFTYAPAATFAGTDSFTYWAWDGDKLSAPATVTLTVTASSCAPRPRVVSRPVVGGGKLQVHIEATPLTVQENNVLKQVIFTKLDNAKVTLNGQAISAGDVHMAPPNTHAVDFTVERAIPGAPATVSLTVVDACSPWPTFVGGGTGAGF